MPLSLPVCPCLPGCLPACLSLSLSLSLSLAFHFPGDFRSFHMSEKSTLWSVRKFSTEAHPELRMLIHLGAGIGSVELWCKSKVGGGYVHAYMIAHT